MISEYQQLQWAVYGWWQDCLRRGYNDVITRRWSTRLTNDEWVNLYYRHRWHNKLVTDNVVPNYHNVVRCIRKIPGATSCKIRLGKGDRENGTRFPKIMEARRLMDEWLRSAGETHQI